MKSKSKQKYSLGGWLKEKDTGLKGLLKDGVHAFGEYGSSMVAGLTGREYVPKDLDYNSKFGNFMGKAASTYGGITGKVAPGLLDGVTGGMASKVLPGVAGALPIGGEQPIDQQQMLADQNRMLQLQNMQGNFQGQQANNQSIFAYGGNMKSTYAMGGDIFNGIQEFKGKKHEQGGISLNDYIEVEDGETRGQGATKDFIFSDRLKFNDKSFAETSKDFSNKYKNQPNDTLTAFAKNRELNNLALAQELFKANEGVKGYTRGVKKMMQIGGNLYDDPLRKNIMSGAFALNADFNNYREDMGDGSLISPYLKKELGVERLLTSKGLVNASNNMTGESYNNLMTATKKINPKLSDQLKITGDEKGIGGSGGSGDYSSTPSMDALGIIAAGLPNLFAGFATNKLKKNIDYGQIGTHNVNPELVDPTRAIQDVNTGFNQSQGYLRQNALGRGNYLSNMIGLSTNRGSAQSDVYSKFGNINADIRNRAGEFNANQASQTDRVNSDLRMREIQDKTGIEQNAISLFASAGNNSIQAYNADKNFRYSAPFLGGPNVNVAYSKDWMGGRTKPNITHSRGEYNTTSDGADLIPIYKNGKIVGYNQK